ncbi:hypothetical protein [Paraburkholderia caledonica]|uniref:hypothetical protein n=1 Tax=Paraburkholderia caledonica TaxID=134536 RepID=UPI000DEEB3F6|nr:hypothetical protein [Paraburkholderia caledonica]AXF14581.1 hypothetical protein CUJ87_09335 [Paraburkholderia caledonica]
MEMTFEVEGLIAGKDEKTLTEIIAAAQRDNSTARLVIARNDLIAAAAQHRLIAIQLQEAERE